MTNTDLDHGGRGSMAALLLLLAAISALPPARASELTQSEIQSLSPICRALFGGSGGRNERLRPFAYELAGSCGVHHTCNGELAMLRYQRAGLTKPPSSKKSELARHERQRKGLLQKAVGEFSYETRCAKPTYPLLPMIYTERGKALALQGRHAQAMADFSRALEMDPNYAPARQGLAAAQVRATARGSSR